MDEQTIAKALIHLALQPTVSIGIAAVPPSEDKNAFRSASGALVYISGVPLLITNWHVIEAYRTLSAQRSMQFFFADQAIDPIERLRDENQDLDLAILFAYNLRILSTRENGVPNIKPFEPIEWPPQPPKRGDSVFFAGWPEVGRSVDVASREATFQPYAYVGAHIADVGNGGFTIEFDRARSRGVTGRETQQQINERDLTGLSGSPIFRDRSSEGLSPDLIGFVKEHMPVFDVLIATSALHIRPELRIERHMPKIK